MWSYIKSLEFPVKIKCPDARAAKIIISQYGGPDGELGASLRYLSQRFAMPCPEAVGILNDVGTEELAHLEMVGSIIYQLTRNLTEEQIKSAGLDAYFVDHSLGVYPQAAAGVPFNAMAIASKGDPITDLNENLAAEQKARTTYDNILRLVSDPDVREPIKFLREREIVHYQRFGEQEQPTWNEIELLMTPIFRVECLFCNCSLPSSNSPKQLVSIRTAIKKTRESCNSSCLLYCCHHLTKRRSAFHGPPFLHDSNQYSFSPFCQFDSSGNYC